MFSGTLCPLFFGGWPPKNGLPQKGFPEQLSRLSTSCPLPLDQGRLLGNNLEPLNLAEAAATAHLELVETKRTPSTLGHQFEKRAYDQTQTHPKSTPKKILPFGLPENPQKGVPSTATPILRNRASHSGYLVLDPHPLRPDPWLHTALGPSSRVPGGHLAGALRALRGAALRGDPAVGQHQPLPRGTLKQGRWRSGRMSPFSTCGSKMGRMEPLAKWTPGLKPDFFGWFSFDPHPPQK